MSDKNDNNRQSTADVVIIGAGTAGLTAAIYVQRAGKQALVLEGASYGGQIINTLDIENYPGLPHISGFDYATALYNQAKELGAQIVMEAALSITYAADTNADKAFLADSSENAENSGSSDSSESPEFSGSSDNSESAEGFKSSDSPDRLESPESSSLAEGGAKQKDLKCVHTRNHDYLTRAVILATGVRRRELGLPDEKELAGKGVSYCATCDGAFYRKKDVAVNGGGNTALEDAEFLTRFCHKVYLIHRRDQFRGDEAEVKKITGKPNLALVLNSTIDALQTGRDGKLSAVETVDKFTKKKTIIPVSGLFVAIGQIPSNQAFADMVALDEAGYIKAGEDTHTSTPGIFAAGDCRTKKVRQLTTAAGDGAVAGLAACDYLQN